MSNKINTKGKKLFNLVVAELDADTAKTVVTLGNQQWLDFKAYFINTKITGRITKLHKPQLMDSKVEFRFKNAISGYRIVTVRNKTVQLHILKGAGGPSYDPDAIAFFGADDFSTAFYDDKTAKQTVNDLVVKFKDDGTWDEKVFIYPNVGGTQATIAKNLKDPTKYLKTYPNGATFDVSGEKFNGTSQYARTHCLPAHVMSSYSVCARWMVKETSYGVDDYIVMGLEPGFVIDHYFSNRLFVVLGAGNAPANVWNLNPATFGKLMAINYYNFNTVDFWQDGVKRGTQTNAVRGYLPPGDPTNTNGDLFLGADNANGNGTPGSFSPFTYFYQDLGHSMDDAKVISDDTYIKTVFCPALHKIPD